MAKVIKYTGTVDAWSELPYTGKQAVWHPGQQESRSDVEANKLYKTGKFGFVGSSLDQVGFAFYKASAATGDPQTDYANLVTAVSAAAAAAAGLELPMFQTYVLPHVLVLPNNFKLRGNFSTIKLANQVSQDLTAPTTLTSANGDSQSVTFAVADSSVFFVDMQVALDDRTTAGQKTFAIGNGTVTAIPDSTHVTVDFVFSQGVNTYVTTKDAGTPGVQFIETGGVSYTWPVGAKLASICGLISAPTNSVNIHIEDLWIDGNSANNPLCNRWELGSAMKFNASDATLRNIFVMNTFSDGIYVGGRRQFHENIWMVKTNSLGYHFGADAAVTGAQKVVVKKVFIDSPGMGTAQIGHYGGLSSDNPAYAGFGFSLNTDHITIDGFDIKNTYSAPLSQGIGCIVTSSNFKLQFSNGYISDMALGAFQICGSATLPYDIDISNVHVKNCGPAVLNQPYNTGAGSDAKYCSFIGTFVGSAARADRIRIKNCDFTDSPLIIQHATNVSLSNVEFLATSVASSSTLHILSGASAAATTVWLSNVRAVRPKGATTGQPSASQFNSNIYVDLATVRGDRVSTIGGGFPFDIRSGSDVQISNYNAEDNYYFGIRARGTGKLHLESPVIRLNSGAAADTTWAGIENNSGGGTGGYTTVISPDIEAATTNAGQHGINLSPNSAAGAATKVVGGIVKVSGTSSTPIASGGATAVNVVAGVLLSHTFTPGAAEVGANNTVSANI